MNNTIAIVILEEDMAYAIDIAPTALPRQQYLIARNRAILRKQLLSEDNLQEGIAALYAEG